MTDDTCSPQLVDVERLRKVARFVRDVGGEELVRAAVAELIALRAERDTERIANMDRDEQCARAESQAAELTALRSSVERLKRELAETRVILAGGDHGSLPNDWTLPRVAEARMDDIHKLTWQVHDTCARAERAEASLAVALKALEAADNYISAIDERT